MKRRIFAILLLASPYGIYGDAWDGQPVPYELYEGAFPGDS